MIKYDNKGKLIGFFCKRGDINSEGVSGFGNNQKPFKELTEREKLIKKLKEISKPQFIKND